MKITYKCDYALKAILDLSLNYDRKLVTTSHDIAERIDAPVKFLEQVLFELKNAGFLESRRGRVGGYSLAREPDKITVGQIVRLIEGPLEPIACVEEKYSNCSDINRCVFKKIWHRLAQTTSNIIDSITFKDLLNEVNSRQDLLSYSI